MPGVHFRTHCQSSDDRYDHHQDYITTEVDPVDQGNGFVSRDLDLWAYERGVTLDFSRPGKPTDNGFIESFNGKFRAECLRPYRASTPLYNLWTTLDAIGGSIPRCQIPWFFKL